MLKMWLSYMGKTLKLPCVQKIQKLYKLVE